MKPLGKNKKRKCSAYLDIETTGLSPYNGYITVIGICLEKEKTCRFIQLVGKKITAVKLQEIMSGTDIIYTYNGARFDLWYIREKLNIDLTIDCHHRDLMYDCWKQKLFGGLKGVEKKLGIKRVLKDMDGRMAVKLWWDFHNKGDEASLKKLLDYNKEDVMNLRVLRKKLDKK